MKKLTLIFLITLLCSLFTIHSFSQPCLPEGITFTSQAQIDNFQINNPNCSEIEGDVLISGDLITNLNGLSGLVSIGGDLRIESNSMLTALSGLDNLHSIGGSLIIGYFYISNVPYDTGNPLLESLSGLDGLTTLSGDLKIYGNPSLASLAGLEGLVTIGGSLHIGTIEYMYGFKFGNPSLTDLTGLDNLNSVGGALTIAGNDSLVNLQGLDNLKTIGGFCGIVWNEDLQDITGLENLTSIGGDLEIKYNGALTNLTGLEKVTSVGDLSIEYNHSMTSLTGLENLTSIGGTLYISGNDSLTSLTPLENIDANSITYISIAWNLSLSYCEVKSICEFLESPGSSISILFNAPGCNSPEEVLAACEAFSVDELSAENKFIISPNPLESSTTITYTLQENSPVTLTILETSGREIAILVNEVRQQGEQQVVFNSRGLPAGVYFCVLKTNEGMQTTKLIKL